MSRLQEIIDKLSTHGSLRVRSALNPFLWGIGTIGAVVAASMFARPPEWVYAALVGIFFLAVLVTLGVGVFMAIARPDDLRSEEYLLEQKRLSMYRDTDRADEPIPSKELEALPDPKRIEDEIDES